MGGEKDLSVAQNVDLTRYQGRWFEIASMPSRFQPTTGTNSRATYALKEDQTVDVLNETWLDGKRSYINGTAWKVDPASPDAKLKVRFVVPPFFPIFPVTGDYWVMKLDENYQWALVGQPSRKFLWVLSRTPELSEDVYKELLDHATNEGYDVSRLQKTEQIPGVGEGDETSVPADGNTDKAGVWWLKSLFGK
jgi:apolipoprotein D and lipocalin family protein